MLNVRFQPQNNDPLFRALNILAGNAQPAINRGLAKAVREILRRADDWVNGPGAKSSNIDPGGYPVPNRTGNLRQLLYMVLPGKTKSLPAANPYFRSPGTPIRESVSGSVAANMLEAFIGDSAEYANVIRKGTGSSKDYGPRPFLEDAVEEYDRDVGIAATIAEAIWKDIHRLR